jgi:putative phosphoesterase
VREYSADVIVYGHTHKPLIETIGNTLIVNPGAAGPRRFKLQPSIAILTVDAGRSNAMLAYLDL